MQVVPIVIFFKNFQLHTKDENVFNVCKILLVAMSNELHKTGGEELIFEKVGCLLSF